MLKKLASFTREYANPDHPLNDGSGRTVGEAFTCKDGNYSVNRSSCWTKFWPASR